MVATRSKRKYTRRNKSVKQLQTEEYKKYSCDNCKWASIESDWCRLQDCSIALVHCCKLFEEKLGKRDCTKCKYYNSRKNAISKCKIGIYNCKGVIKNV